MKKVLLAVFALFLSSAAIADISQVEMEANSLQVQEGNGIIGMSYPYPPSTIPGVNRITLQTEAIKQASDIHQYVAQRFVLGIFTDWESLPIVAIVNDVTEFSVLLWDGSSAYVGKGPITGDSGGLRCHIASYRGATVAYCPDVDGYLIL